MRLILAALVAVALLVRPAFADLPRKPAQFQTPTVCVTEGGSRLELPPGWWLFSPEQFARVDAELREAQDDRTRLAAENESLRGSVRKARPRLYYIVGALVAGFAAGAAYKALR